MGIERLLLLLENQKTEIPPEPKCDLYIATMGNAAELKATEISSSLRFDGFEVQTDICSRGLKAQMKFADKIGAKFSMVLGDNELQNNKAVIKNMATGDTSETALDNISDKLSSLINGMALESLTDSVLNNK